MKKILSVVAGAALVLSLATGCQATAPDISTDQAKEFQARVLAVTSAVAEGGYAAALEALTVLETELDAAAAEGTVSFARHQRIEAALMAVRADIQAAIDAAAVPEPAPQETVAPVRPVEEQPAPDTETDAEKKAREDAEKAAAKAAEDAAKKAEEAKKKAAEDAAKKAEDERKAAEEAAKKAAEEAKKKAEEEATEDTESTDGDG